MPRKQQTVDDEREPQEVLLSREYWGTSPDGSGNVALAVAMPPPPEVLRLWDSDIITVDDNHDITFRPGHLEHIANLYVGDPSSTERDYADDLAVARAYCRERWEALTKND